MSLAVSERYQGLKEKESTVLLNANAYL